VPTVGFTVSTEVGFRAGTHALTMLTLICVFSKGKKERKKYKQKMQSLKSALVCLAFYRNLYVQDIINYFIIKSER
jgi:hypothetical protein